MGKSETFAKALEKRAAERRRTATVLTEKQRMERLLTFWQAMAGVLLSRIPGQKAVISFDEADAIEGLRLVHDMDVPHRVFRLSLARKPEDAA